MLNVKKMRGDKHTLLTSTYRDIGVYLVLLPIFSYEPTAELVHTGGHNLKSFMVLWEYRLQCPDLVFECI